MLNLFLPFNYTEDKDMWAVDLEFIRLTREQKDLFRYDVNVACVYGSFAGCIWNGGRYLEGEKPSYETIRNVIESFNNIGVAFRLTFTNQYVSGKYLHDEYANKILDIASESGINEILVNNLELEEYIKTKHPGQFKYTKSCTRCEADIDTIDSDTNAYDLVVLDYRDNDKYTKLSNIKHKDKIEIMLNDICSTKCPYRKLHHQYIQKQCLFGPDSLEAKESEFYNIICPHRVDVLKPENIVYDDDSGAITSESFDKLVKLGFSNFKIVGRDFDAHVLVRYYNYYLVKKDHEGVFKYTLNNLDIEKITQSHRGN